MGGLLPGTPVTPAQYMSALKTEEQMYAQLLAATPQKAKMEEYRQLWQGIRGMATSMDVWGAERQCLIRGGVLVVIAGAIGYYVGKKGR